MEGQYVLTERTIRDAKPQDRQYMIWDPKLKGFGVKVSKRVKSYVVDYRVDGYQRRATIGRVGGSQLTGGSGKGRGSHGLNTPPRP